MDLETIATTPPAAAAPAHPSVRRITPFRADINGLRAVALLLVTAFHYAVPGFGSAFVGVEVFFVVSGYLITQILVATAGAGRGTWWAFYRSRITRIYPPLVAMLAVLLALGYFFLEPGEYLRLGRHTLYGLGGIINYRLFAEIDYFAPERESIWLLHLWTVGAEVQFYLLAPPLLWWAQRRGRLTAVVAAVTGLSFAAGIYTGLGNPSAAFYLTPFRLWEFFAGALAFQLSDRVPTRWRSYCAPLGVLLIAASLPITAAGSLPAATNAVTVAGTMLVLAGRSNFWLLTNPISRWTGLISYSFYLWHWPVWVAAHHFGRTDTALDVAGLVIITFGLALAWRFAVERPFHASSKVQLPRWRTLVIAPASCAVAIAAVVIVTQAGLPARVPSLIADVSRSAMTVDGIRQDRCFLSPPAGAEKLADECFAGAGDGEVLIFGDSHAAHLWPGIADAPLLRPFPMSQVTAGSCPPLIMAPPATPPTREPGAAQFDAVTGIVVQCPSITRRAFDYIEQTRPSLVVLAGGWAYYDTHGTDVIGGLRAVVARLTPLGVHVLIVGPIPQWTPALPQRALEETFRHGGMLPMRMHDSSHAALTELDQRLAAMSREIGAAYLSLRELLCNGDGCLAQVTGRDKPALTAWDSAHLTLPGSQWVVDRGLAPAIVRAAGEVPEPAQ